jgi:hypothetical protein
MGAAGGGGGGSSYPTSADITLAAQPGNGQVTITYTLDSTPPTITCSARPNRLWPPNHKLANVSTTVNVTDAESGPAGFILLSVTSTEPDSGLSPEDLPNDIQGWTTGTADTSGKLRAERFDAQNGRTYTLTYEGRDAAGNTAQCSTTIRVEL